MGATAAGAATKGGNGLILTGLLLGVLLAALDQSVIGTAIPSIVEDLRDFEHIAALATAYMLASAIVIPLAGKFSDLYGRRPVYLLGMGVFLVGSMLCGTATSMTQLIVWRFVQGLGGGMIFPVAIATIADLYAPSERGRVQGLFGAMFGLASVIGPFVGGWIVDYVHLFGVDPWRWVFYVNLPVGAVGIFMVATHFPRTVRKEGVVIDWGGIATLTTALTAIVLVAQWGGTTYAWSDPLVLGLSALALLSLGGFLMIERRAVEPIIPLRLFREPIFAVSGAIGFLMGIAMFVVILFMPTYMQGVVGISATSSGLVLMPLSLALVGASITSGFLMRRVGYKPFILASTLIVASGFLLLRTLGTAPPIWLAILVMIYMGLGIGMSIQTVIVAAQNAVEKRYVGAATSSITLLRTLGATVGIATMGSVLNSRLESELPARVPAPALDAILDSPFVAGNLRDVPQVLLRAEFVASAPSAVIDGIKTAFTESLATVWLASAAVALAAFFVALFLRRKALQTAEEYHGTAARPAAEP